MERLSPPALPSLGGITPAQLRALIILDRSPRVGLTRFAAGMRLPLPMANRLADRLVASGLASRHRPVFGREPVLRLSVGGRETLARFDALRAARLRA